MKGKLSGRKVLGAVASIVTPHTILAWHRKLIAKKCDYSAKKENAGCPRTEQAIMDLTVRMALGNLDWGYTRIQGALANLGYRVSRGTVANILREQGIEPGERRQNTLENPSPGTLGDSGGR